MGEALLNSRTVRVTCSFAQVLGNSSARLCDLGIRNESTLTVVPSQFVQVSAARASQQAEAASSSGRKRDHAGADC